MATFYTYNTMTREKLKVGDVIRIDLANGETLEIRPCENGIDVSALCRNGSGLMRIVPVASNRIQITA